MLKVLIVPRAICAPVMELSLMSSAPIVAGEMFECVGPDPPPEPTIV